MSTVDDMMETDRFNSRSRSQKVAGAPFSRGPGDPQLGKVLDPQPSRRSLPHTSSPSTSSHSVPSRPLNTASKSSIIEESCAKRTELAHDFSASIKGIYRLLDLITEQGNDGLVDKIVVAQESLQAFINALSPGSYSSITKVSFETLDDFILEPLGVYGSKEEIVRFLRETGAVDVKMARALLVPQGDYIARGTDPILRSGLYIMRTFISTSEEQTYVFYWPEDTTWDDGAVSTVQRNRVLFMRYLTKLCDQLVCLLSSKHSQAIVWGDKVDGLEDTSLNSEDVDLDRFFDFMVAKRSEKEENLGVRQGFTIHSSRLVSQPPPPEMHINPSILSPRLLCGETTQGFMTADCRPARATFEPFSHDDLSASQIRLFLEDDTVLCLSETLNDNARETLMRLGLSARYPKGFGSSKERGIETDNPHKAHNQRHAEITPGALQEMVREAVIIEILKAFPMLQRDRFFSESSSATQAEGALQDLFSNYPKTELLFRNSIRAANLEKGIDGGDFRSKKQRMLILRYLLRIYKDLNTDQIRSLCNDILFIGDEQKTLGRLKSFTMEGNHSVVLQKVGAMWRDAHDYATSISDLRFLLYVKTIPAANFLHDAADECEEAAYDWVTTQVDSLVPVISQQILSIQKDYLHRELSGSRDRIHIDALRTKKKHRYTAESYFISGRRETWQDQEIEYTVHNIRFLADQAHNLQLNPSYVPTPVLNERLSQSFHISLETVVKYAYLLEGDQILLCLVDSQGNVMILLDLLSHIDGAMQSRSYAKVIHNDILGGTRLFVFDESKRMLAVYASMRMQLHIFVFDEELKYLWGLGAPIDLSPCYNPGVSITHMCFVHGREEILFVDSSAQARIFSLITQQLKPTFLQLPQVPRGIYSAPDGSCVLVVQDEDGQRTMTAHHWSTFAATRGISVTLPAFPVDLDAALLTSVVYRNNIHLVGLDLDTRSCRSVVLDITRKATKFALQERQSEESSRHGKQNSHNCLIECHSDVWTHFPLVPAIDCHIITPSSQRTQKTLVFVTDDHRRPFSSRFSDLITAFEKASRKPTGNKLKNIVVSTRPFPSFKKEFISSPNWPVSHFRASEWLAGLLCLIPINIAVTRDNRFIPLKDGLISPQLEKSLLGAEVNRIVDSLSIGWYESIFQSYWTSKPVKVVSSMGEQSVGKSFTLNHLLGASFSGGGLGTTEGVWMSASPTEDALIVALDFDGIHSPERSAEGDMLLVLFNAAISNLVLFRNNFPFSRDIGGLFQSFHSSLSILDPACDPSLFQSTLVVIIKDVVDSDKAEVIKRFALKFQKIVQDEEDDNFITRLHAGKLQIAPWPVIGSADFYRHFSALKKQLDQERTLHGTASEFSFTLKTLMAKLKANDWRATSQTVAAHRASSLLEILPVALQTGYSEVVPALEPLKCLDMDLVIQAEDTEARFLLAGPETLAADLEHHFSILRDTWDRSTYRQQADGSEWVSDLGQHLTRLVDLRVAHVEEWLRSNTQSFKVQNASMEELRRAFDSAVIDLRASVQLCRSECAECNLLCIRSRFHDGVHNCLTNHDCIHNCAFCGLSEKPCDLIAGHSGDHVCNVDIHPCGMPCQLSGKRGCADECVKSIQHEGEHICSATLHTCDQPCDLIDLELPGGKTFTCPGKCRVPITEEHTAHACEARLCPMACQLCMRLCSSDHLHSLSAGENHLCGQEHACKALCSAAGICQIDTSTQSMEAKFTGSHETFQYTKYSQIARRLRCVRIIKPGAVEHDGLHIHSNEAQPFHFCESQCETCSYLCTLPQGHAQQEHATSHGSMSRTRWVADGPEGSCNELGGHKFLSKDDDAPMLCNLACMLAGRHVHIDDCHGDPHHPEAVHLNERIFPNPEQAKDMITHGLYWRRTGFKDPYTREDQTNFAKCDAMCPGPEHTAEGGGINAKSSYCTLPMFHPHMNTANALGYVSTDGHHFACKDPMVIQQAFHIIFVIDRLFMQYLFPQNHHLQPRIRSGSMDQKDRQPLPNSAGSELILQKENNRLGAVFSALFSFWIARQAALDRSSPIGGGRRDSYSLIFFNHEPETSPIKNDFTSSPDELLTAALEFGSNGGTDFHRALERTEELMISHWSTERTPVVIFLSDGEDYVRDDTTYKICRSATSQGKPLSFHAISFGEESSSSSLRRMAQIALEVQNDWASDPLYPAGANVPSSYTEALDTVRVAETLLGIAESLRKSRF